MALRSVLGEITLGKRGVTQRDNRAAQESGELVETTGVTLEDRSVQKAFGLAGYDAAGVGTVPLFLGTATASDTWAGQVGGFYGTALTHVGTTTAAGLLAGVATSFSLPIPVAGYAAGQLVVVTVLLRTTSPLDSITGVTDSQGNTYTALTTNALLANALTVAGRTQTFYSVIGTPLVTGVDQIVVTFSAMKAGVAAATNFTSATGFVAGPATTGRSIVAQSSVIVGPAASMSQVPVLLVAGIALTTEGCAPTGGSGFTEAIEHNIVPGTVTVNYRIDTAPSTIIALHSWESEVETTPAGTVSTTAGLTTVTGAGTTFTNHAPGDAIIVTGETQIIETITSNTVLDTVDPWARTNAPLTAYARRVGSRIITATTGGAIYKEKPTSLTTGDLDNVTLTSFGSRIARPGKFVVGGKESAALPRRLFYFNGSDPVQILSGDGTTMTAITTGPSDWDTVNNPSRQPISGTIHNSRLAAWGNLNDPHRVYFSSPDDHDDFTTTPFSLRVSSNIGNRLMCGLDYQGILIFWKYPTGIFYLDDTDLTTSNWFIRTKSEALGCAASPYAALSLDDDVLFLTADGQFHTLSSVDTFGGMQASNLGELLGFSGWLRDNLNLSRLHQAVSVWYPDKKLAIWGLPGAGSATNNLTLIFDFSGVRAGNPVRFLYSERDSVDAVALHKFSDGIYRPIIGEAGFVWLTEQTTRTKDGVFYEASFKTAPDDFSAADPALRFRRKTWEHLELMMEPVDAGSLTVEVYVDGALRQTLTMDPTLRRDRRKLNVGDGYDIAVKVSSVLANDADTDCGMNILSLGVWFNTGNEDLNR